MQTFVSWSLEREHGDLQLHSKNPRKPLHSALGRELVASASATKHRDYIVSQAGENMELARARLETFHSMDSLDDFSNQPKDTLPAHIISLFNAGLARILQQIPAERQLGLWAIAEVAREGGIRSRDLESRLREAARLSDPPLPPHRSLEEVFQAAQGFLVTEIWPSETPGESEFWIRTYCPEFQVFASEEYNGAFSRAMMDLPFGRLTTKHGGRRAGSFS